MEILAVLGLAMGLAADAFAVALAASVSLGAVSRRQVFRLAFHFGLFQALMPVLGWLAGQAIDPYIRDWDHWLAFAVLSFVGGKAIHDAVRGDDDTAGGKDPTRGWTMVALSVATSIDAFAIGLTFAMLRAGIGLPAAVIGVVTAMLVIAAMLLGARLGRRFGQRMEIAGGVVLIAIGLRIVVSHLA